MKESSFSTALDFTHRSNSTAPVQRKSRVHSRRHGQQEKLHVAIFPWLAFGHILPYLEVATFLAEKGHRVSFISTPKNLRKLPTDLPPSLTLVELPLPRVDGLPDLAESTAELPIKRSHTLRRPTTCSSQPSQRYFSRFPRTAFPLDRGPVPRPGLDRRSQVDRLPVQEDRRVDSRFKFVAVRSCPEFEADPLRLLEKLYGKPVVPVGLLPPAANAAAKTKRWVELKRWLDDKKEKSVFYIGLGTEVNISPEMIVELAGGIEKSGLPFVWVVGQRPGPENIPPGFESQVAGRGYMWMGWAPQAEILAHPAIGGILSHCGWSSAIESLGQGRPLILFSGANSDQGLMGRLFEERGVGFEVPRDEADGSFTSDSLAQTIRRVMVEPDGEQVRANAWAMREIFGNYELQNKYLEKLAQVMLA
ncbi:UDP-glycosyltransferase 91C1-like [Eucalyptus grandis]|uniref:UDP-glycosyltransferase 91C1-like n=1 Tax=Eucalyptus grandis TaxID=71139 RepID=UPI00192E846D|nr:UDP-glycosyltransferase 91C1-like [Eucalyptus grandis]